MRRNTRSESHLRIQNMTDKVADIVKVKIKDRTLYQCMICGNIYSRRFNAKRHYKRFHETTQARRCCGKTFYTKSDYYDHKENVHNEKKRYGRNWKEGTQSLNSSSEYNAARNEHQDCALDVTETSISVEITKERTSEKCANTNNVHHVQNNAKNSESNNKKEFKNNAWHPWQSTKVPKKIFIYRIQEETNRNQNSTPLRSIENFTENSPNKTSSKNALQNIVKVNSRVNKENVIIYKCTATSVLNLMQLMQDTIDF